MRKVIVLLLAFSILTVACSSPNSTSIKNQKEPKVITLWSVDTGNKKYIENAINKFNDTHNDLRIKTEFYDDEALKIKIKVAVVGNKLPDIFSYWAGEKFKSLVDAGAVGDITKQIDGDAQFKDDFLPGELDAFSYDGKTYGIPFGPSAVALWYNKEIFEKYGLETPKTYDELLTVVDKLNANKVIPITVAGKDRWPVLHWYSYLAQRIGGDEPFSKAKNGEADFTDPSFVEAGKKLQELAINKKGFINGFLGLDYAAAESMFVSGKAAMYLQGEWAIQAFVKDKAFSEKVGFVPFPTVEGGKGNSGTFQGGFGVGYAISSKADKDAAYSALKFILSPEQRKEITETGKISPMKSVKLDPAKTNPLVYDFANFIGKEAKAFNGYYDQQLDPKSSDKFLNFSTKVAGDSNVDVLKELKEIK
jgi:raffinose/stachyose/melibiose transport system substrate-binding protein